MRLSQILAPQVSTTVRSRGAAYHASGAVTRLVVTDGVIAATVVGGDAYGVLLDPTEGSLRASCTCPYFVDRFDICKHVWATLLTAEARAIPLLPPGVAPKDLELEPLPFEDEDALLDDAADDADADDWEGEAWPGSGRTPNAAGASASTPGPERWKHLLHSIAAAPGQAGLHARPRLTAQSLLYVIDIEASIAAGLLVVEVMARTRKANGEWAKPKPIRVTIADIRALPHGEDRRLLERLLGARPRYDLGGYGDVGELKRFTLEGVLVAEFLPALCAGDRGMARVPAPPDPSIAATPARPPSRSHWAWAPPPPKPSPPLYLPLQYDDAEPWRFTMTIQRDAADQGYVIAGALVRGDARMEVTDPLLVLGDGLLVTRSHVARLDDGGAFAWLTALRQGPVTVPATERLTLIDAMLVQAPPVVDAPVDLQVTIDSGTPRPSLRLRPSRHRPDQLEARLLCDYDGMPVVPGGPYAIVRNQDASRIVRRDLEAERAFVDTLHRLGFKQEWSTETQAPVPQIATRHLPRVVRTLLAEHWHVEASGVTYRQSVSTSMQVTSGIDWFDLEGHADYGGQQVALPALLAALRRGDGFVQLGDGTMGLLPEAWLRKHGMLASVASPEGDRLRFRSSQVAILDALLAERPETTCDEAFTRARAALQSFDGIAPVDPPASFTGTLRGYQREGLGWLLFLQRFGFGGCLADDMGLGKTIMVLALLAHEQASSRTAMSRRPSLVVAPRSLIFNWRQEAERFAPGLRVLEYTGGGRAALREAMPEHDLVLTTYGTLRRDAEPLASVPFNYVVLDEAQAIKNAASASSKATRLLQARHRLALSGTPIENHLGELWSLFEFLNPGVLGGLAAFQGTTARTLDEAAVTTLARGLRPFILRRTKAQVAPELPQKTEQTLYCELERPQRALYDQLREHYRAVLLDRVSRTGLGRAKLQVLEALLRLRQAACHPGLIDPKRAKDASAKLDVLLPHIAQAVEEGHKTLVFSQFTSLLAILRTRLDADGIPYEYLDGRTRDRETTVERFQTDPDCRLFLISLKAGGVGLNLTAAEYVFLLDPWWNPAVEAQAIDRAHRIGQARQVFAYRLIAKDTVEERVLELQRHKRTLADAVLSADGSLLKTLKREDLELLLS